MAIETIPNQPIVFNKNDELCKPCSTINEAIVRYDKDDIIPILIKLSPCPNEPNVIKNGSFDTVSDWIIEDNCTIATGKLIKSYGYKGKAKQLNAFNINEIYEVNITVDVLQGKPFNVLIGSVIAKKISVSGVYKFLVNGSFLDLILDFPDSDTYCEISDITAYRISGYHYLVIKDESGAIVEDVNNIKDIYTCLSDSYAVLEFNAPTAVGCYTIEMVSPCSDRCLYLGSKDKYFNSELHWDVTVNNGTPDYSFGDGFSFEGNGSADEITLCTLNTLCQGQYKMSIDITDLQNTDVEILINGLSQIAYNTNGQYTFVYNALPGDVLCLRVTQTGSPSTVKIKSFDIYIHKKIDIENFVDFNIVSQKVIIDDYSSNCNMKKIALCNNNDANGFAACFTPYAWYDASLINPLHISNERIVYDLNNGTKRLQYSEKIKEYELNVDMIDEYAIDFLSLIPFSHHVIIDNKEYFSSSDEVQLSYSIDYPNHSTLSIKLLESIALINVNMKKDGVCSSIAATAVIKPFGTDLLGDGESGGGVDVVVGISRS